MNSQLKSALILLDNVFLNNATFTRATFKERLQNDDDNLKFSDTTITRLLGFIQEIFGISLKFNRNGTIEIQDFNHENEKKYQFVKSLLLFGKIKEDSHLINHHFSFSNDCFFHNSELIIEIYDAIIRMKQIKVSYQKFNNNTKKEYILKPFMIKEYLGRWYLVGKKVNDEFVVFGIDRINTLEILNSNFEPCFNFLKLYENTIGVNYSADLIHVVLWAEDYQMKLFETYPLHQSQKIISRDEKGGFFSLDVVLNYEFKQLLASFLLKVKIIEPKELKEEMKQMFILMADNN